MPTLTLVSPALAARASVVVLFVLRNVSASLVDTRSVVDVPGAVGVEPDTLTYGVPPTSLPKSRTTMADGPPGATARTVEPLP